MKKKIQSDKTYLFRNATGTQFLKPYPIVFSLSQTKRITGPIQVGKTALVRKVFPNADYVFLDLPSIASQAETVPKEFLQRYRNPLIIDEVQYAPSLFRYLKVMIDLMQGISESLAGRCGVLNMLNLSAAELNMEENPFPKTSKSGLF